MNGFLALSTALLVLLGQLAPVLHLALDSRHEHHDCCTHDTSTAHWCTCEDPDHHAPCPGCESLTLQAADLPSALAHASEPASTVTESPKAASFVPGRAHSLPSARAPPLL